ncbi:MAG: ASPIC/UnbV domain-containing protein, partial [Gammaproteobacteria bacterium]
PIKKGVFDVAVGDFNGDLFNDMIQVITKDRPSNAYLVNSTTVETQLNTTGMNIIELTIETSGSLTFPQVDDKTWNRYSSNDIFVGSGGANPSGTSFTLDVNNTNNHGLRNYSGSSEGLYIGYNTTEGAWKVIFPAGDRWNYAHFVIESSAAITSIDQPSSYFGDKPSFPVLLTGSTSGFQDVTAASGFEKIECASVASGDFDNDMDLDVYFACRNGAANLTNILYENQGNGSFVKVGSHGAEGVIGGAIADGAGNADIAITADYDLDGQLDIFVANGLNMRPINKGGPKQLFRNMGNANRWIEFDLVGTTSNRDGTGSIIHITTPDGKVQYREQNGGYHRWSQNHMRVHVGLGSNPNASIEVRWPSGVVDTYASLNAGTIYKLTENGSATVFLEVSPDVDSDGDGILDSVDPDDDNDGVLDVNDAFPFNPNESVDSDGDGVGDNSDAFPNNPNETNDADGDGVGDNSDVDTDNDGITNTAEKASSGSITVFNDNFETNLGWVTNPNGSDSASTGRWEVANPQATSNGGTTLQLNNTTSGSRALVTQAAAGSSVGTYDIDSGVTSARSPAFTVPASGPVSLKFNYYFGHLNNAGSDDFFRASLVVGGNTVGLLTQVGNNTNRSASWTAFNADISQYAGQSVRLLVEAADNGSGSLVEAGVDDVVVTGSRNLLDADGDSILNGFDLDSDNDSIPDVVEVGLFDADGNGIVDDLVNQQGTITSPRDTDGDGIPDFLDLESQNASNNGTAYDMATGSYASLDTNNDGMINGNDAQGGTDANGNGIDDAVESAISTACFEPAYDRATEAGVFLWDLCDGSGLWRVRVTGGGTSTGLTYQGAVGSTGGFASFTPYSFEADDVLNNLASNERLEYVMGVWNNGEDGFDFDPVANDACFAPAGPNVPLYLGAGRQQVTSPLNLNTLGSCSVSPPATECGQPAYDSATDTGVFIWKDCGTGEWSVRVTGGGTSTGLSYQGLVESTGGYNGYTPFSFESDDVLNNNANIDNLVYKLNVWNNGQDGFDFTPSSSDACFTLNSPTVPLYLGSGRQQLSSQALNLTSLGACAAVQDSDGDGLSDAEETGTYGTDPFIADTDGGGVNDGDEVQLGTNPLNANDDSLDSDGDGLTDAQELNLGTNPNVADTDGEGLTDGEEVNTYGTNPLLANTDMDGMNDFVEIAYKGTDPLNPDTDGDGLTDGQEASQQGIGTDPLNPDTDGGGTNDGTEVANGTDPLNAADD